MNDQATPTDASAFELDETQLDSVAGGTAPAVKAPSKSPSLPATPVGIAPPPAAPVAMTPNTVFARNTLPTKTDSTPAPSLKGGPKGG